MSKLYDLYSYLKRTSNKSNVLYLFKSGIFYLFIDRDAIIASDILGLKLTNLTDDIVKCGFPTSSLDKYTRILSHCNYTIQIVDSSTEHIYNYSEFKLNDKTQALLYELAELTPDNYSIKEAYEKLEIYKIRAQKILNSSQD